MRTNVNQYSPQSDNEISLIDEYNREFSYLRLSITDVCNYRCNYCLPDGYESCSDEKELSLEEIKTLVTHFADMGIKKVRITGGEPGTRSDLPLIIKTVKSIPGIETVALTTNGYKLNKRINSWVEAGLDAINVSIDSLRPEMFNLITGHDRLDEILMGLNTAIKLGMTSVKVNAVLLKSYNLNQFDEFLKWIKDKPISLRFIELMETSDNTEFFEQNHVRGEDILERLKQNNWQEKTRNKHSGPAREFYHELYQGQIGLIMPYSPDFCNTCNRLRISARGKLHLCLFGETGYDLRPLLSPNKVHSLNDHIKDILKNKSVSHFLHMRQTGATKHLAMLGG
ncbi:GTP 3',8-cyclase MoaA [Bermanella sp. R86510]|uniref:GTP 3',8-cyclase MoaA n=1 Tax=unclassified Bermanella TaxID=2627862 RepID=UPI0037CC51EA